MAHDKVLSRIRAMRGTDIHIKISDISKDTNTPPQAKNRFMAIKAIMDDSSLGYADLSTLCSASIPVIYKWAKTFLSQGIVGLLGKQSGWSGKMVSLSNDTMKQAMSSYKEEPQEAIRVVGQVLTRDAPESEWAEYGWIYRSRISFDKISVYGSAQPLKTAAQIAFDCDRAQRLTIDLPFLDYRLKAYVVDISDIDNPIIIRALKNKP